MRDGDSVKGGMALGLEMGWKWCWVGFGFGAGLCWEEGVESGEQVKGKAGEGRGWQEREGGLGLAMTVLGLGLRR